MFAEQQIDEDRAFHQAFVQGLAGLNRGGEAGREGGPSADDSPARAEYIIDNFRMFV